ncbi:hypothetical protein [Austwickia sp. TVS 96-490-7B]|uniref:hypothetical protein n=1 Tax=Austwickia sp. TVS 96-490-7B TaxID=2830843 RepID=UPI001C5A4D85|nr:hypothetical protein [Austwickia sp. TVS 96-490-7B]
MEKFVASQGYSSHYQDEFSLPHAIEFFLSGAKFYAFAITTLLVVALIVAGVIHQAKGLAIQQLHGHGPVQQAISLARVLSRTAGVTILVAGGLSILSLYPYNKLAFFGEFYVFSVLIACLPLTAGFIVGLLTLRAIQSMDTIASIKGRLPFRTGHLIVYLIRIPTIVLMLAVVHGLSAGALTISTLTSARAESLRYGATYALAMADVPHDDRAGWLRRRLQEVQRDGDLRTVTYLSVLADQSQPRALLMDAALYHRLGHSETPEEKEVFVVTPPSITISDNELKKQVLQSLGGQLGGWKIRRISSTDSCFFAPITAMTGIPRGDRTHQILMVARQPLSLMSPYNVASALSRGEIQFTTREAAEKMLDGPFGQLFTSITSTVDRSDQDLASVRSEYHIQWINAIIVSIALVSSAFTVAMIYMARRGRRDFIRRLHGWRFSQSNLGILSFETFLGVAVAALLLQRVSSQASLLAHGEIPVPSMLDYRYTTIEVIGTLCLIAVSTLIFSLALARVSSSSLRQLSSHP